MLKKHIKPLRKKTGRPFKAALTALILTGSIAATYNVFGHGDNGDGHDADEEEFPDGNTSLLPDDAKNPVLHGWVGPLLPMHTMSVHNTLTWKKNSKMPLMLMFHRHSGYTADEVVNPDIIDFMIAHPNPQTTGTDSVPVNGWGTTGKNPFGDRRNQLNASFRRSFQQFAYGGYNIIHDVSQSVPTRMSVDQTIELTQLWDMNHVKAFEYDFADPTWSAALLNNHDALINFDSFRGVGHSKGLFYDMYCPGFSTLTDGRPVFMGGHDLNSQNGSYRAQIFDPETETWAVRPESCMRKYFGRDAESAAFRVANSLEADDWNLEKFYRAKMAEIQTANPTFTAVDIRRAMTTVYLPGCNPHLLPDQIAELPPKTDPTVYSQTYEGIRLKPQQGTVTHPGSIPSDMKYARWYPTQITLPTNQIFVIAGWDRDEFEVPQDTTNPDISTLAMVPFLERAADYPTLPANADIAGSLKGGGDGNFLNSRVKQVVPEVYDAKSDTTIALENAPIFQNAWYPNGLVIQTGPLRDNWKVACNDAELLGNVPSVLSTTKFDPVTGLGLPVGAHKPTGGERPGIPAVQNRHYHNTWMLDIQAALKDKNRGTPPADVINSTTSTYWKFISDAPSSHSEFTGNANIVELDKLGRVISHKLTHVGGQYPISSSTLAAAVVIGATTVTTTAPLTAKGPYNISTGNAAESVQVISFEGTTATLAKPLTKNHAANAAFTIFGTSKNVEEIDFASLSVKLKKGETAVLPKWEVKGELYQPGRQNYCTPLPDGTIMVLGGNGGNLPGIERWSLHLQMYDPKKPYNPADPATTNSVRKMAKSLIPRDEHGIIQLMPDATVYLGGQNRNGLVQAGDPEAPLGDADLGVPCGQLYRPPYLFDYRGAPAARPVIAQTTAQIDYGRPFKIKTWSLKPIKTVSMLRSGSMSHSINTDVRLVKMAFKQAKNGDITVYPPKLPATAVGGYYQLFIVDDAGVPSEGVKVAVGADITKRVGKPASKYALVNATPVTAISTQLNSAAAAAH